MGARKCCIISCKNTSKNSHYQFYSFPKYQHKLIQREKWISIVRKQNVYESSWNPKPTDLICSFHFIGCKKGAEQLSPNYIPTKFSPTNLGQNLNESAALKRHQRFIKRRLQKGLSGVINSKSAVNSELAIGLSTKTEHLVNENERDIAPDELMFDSFNKSDQECQADIFVLCDSVEKLFCCNRFSFGLNTCEAETQTEINVPTGAIKINCSKKFKNKGCGTSQKVFVNTGVGSDSVYNEFDDGINFQGSVKNDEQLIDLAGVSFDNFNILMNKLPVSKKVHISKKMRLFIFLFKMKTALTFAAISAMFSVHRTTVSRIFYSTLESLAQATASFVFWPDRLSVQATMPDSFKPQYSDTRVIIDCTEFKIDVPSTVDDRVYCYSHYKKGFTIKVLIAITPGGFICFKSPAAGGRKSDSQITIESGFIDFLEEGDTVLADKGFPEIKTIIDNQGKKVIVVMPPFLEKKTEFSPEETEDTYTVARVRIHVERIMQRLRTYHILNKIPEHLFDHVDNIIHMCCVLVNLQPPIFADKN